MATQTQTQQEAPHELATLPVPLPGADGATDVIQIPEGSKETAATIQHEVQEPNDRFKRFASLAALFATLFVVSLNATVLGNAIPTICKELNSAAGYAWIGAAYLLGSAAFAPVWAKFSDIWGRKIILLLTVAGFCCSSVICAVSTSMSMLIAGRALQGTFGGGQMRMVDIVISDLFSMRHRSLYLGLLQVVWALSGGIGPVLGGACAQHLSWRWIFWVMLPPGALSFLLLFFTLEVHNPRTKMIDGLKAVDWAGSFCIVGLLVTLLLGLNFGGVEYPWQSPTVISLMVAGAVMTGFLIVVEKKLARYPLLPMGIFRAKSNIAALVIAFTHDFALFSGSFYLPFFFQSAKALPPLTAGAMMLPTPISMSLVGMVAGWYIHRTGRYVELMWLGLALMCAGQGAWIGWEAASPLGVTIPTQLLAGAGTGLLFAPPLIALQASAKQDAVATTTAAMGLVRNVATVLAVVLGQTILQHGMDARHADLEAAHLPSELLDAFAGNQAAAHLDLIRNISDPLQRRVVEAAFAGALRNIWITDVCLLGLGLGFCGFVVKSKLSEEHTETRTGLKTE